MNWGLGLDTMIIYWPYEKSAFEILGCWAHTRNLCGGSGSCGETMANALYPSSSSGDKFKRFVFFRYEGIIKYVIKKQIKP